MHRTILLTAGAFLALFALVLLGNTQTNHTALAGAVYDVEFTAIDLIPAGNTATHIGPDAVAQATNGIDPGDIQSVLENVPLNTPTTIDIVVDGVNFYDPTNSEDSPACNGAVNDDPGDDALVNDGCPTVSVAEPTAVCTGAVDNDADGTVNDGCPAAGIAETACADATDDDTDTFINDGCPAIGASEPIAACADSVDTGDTDTFVNDGCPTAGVISEANIDLNDTCADGIENPGGDTIVMDDQDTDCYDSGPSGGVGLFGVGFELLYDPAFVQITANNTTATNAFLQFSQAPATLINNSSDIDNNPGDDTDGSFRLDSVGGGPQESGPGRVAQIVFECTAVGHSTLTLTDDFTGGGTTMGVLFSQPSGGTYIVGTEIEADVYCGMSAPVAPATLDVLKVYANNNDSAAVTINVNCINGGPATAIGGDNLASPGDPAHFSIANPGATTSCTATENAAPSGYEQSATTCDNVATTSATTFSCTITNQAVAFFDISKAYSGTPQGAVTVTVSCNPNGTATAVSGDNQASPGDPAHFKVTGFGPGATCTANETAAPSGYVGITSDCLNKTMPPGGTVSCTITNTSTAQLLVAKTVNAGSPGDVTIQVTCTTGSVAVNDATATPGGPDTADFTITGFNTGATCTVTETPVPGYEFSAGDCPSVTLSPGDNDTCTVTNTQISRTFTVNKDFSDDNLVDVIVSVTCNDIDAVITAFPDNTASEAFAAVFTITGDYVPSSTTCSADETQPTGYSKDISNCVNKSLASNASCTIVNNAQATINISKNYEPGANADVVQITLACTVDGTQVVGTNPQPTNEGGAAATWTVSGFHPATLCTATESDVLAGYTQTSGCTNLDPVAGGIQGCTIINEASSTTFTVTKTFVPAVSYEVPVTLTLTCPGTTGTITPTDNQITGTPDTATWTVTGFTQGDTCNVSENLTGAYETTGCQGVLLNQTTTNCNMTNTTKTDIGIVKNFSDDSTATVTLSLNCTGGTVTPTSATATEVPVDNANFVWRGWAQGDTCTVAETPIQGYTFSQSSCSGFLTASYGTLGLECEVTNTLNETTLEVTKVENDPAQTHTLAMTVQCPAGVTVVNTDTGASSDGNDPADFAISGFDPGTQCTVTESPTVVFDQDLSDCTPVTLVVGSAASPTTTSCTVTNTLHTQIVRVSKDFIPDDPQGVTISVACPGSYIGQTNTVTSTDSVAFEAGNDYVEFTIEGFTTGQQCSFTESAPAGTWSANETACANKTLVHGGPVITCTITNSQSITFLVKKNWDPDRATTNVSVTLSCPGATVTPAGAQNASEETEASFTVNDFTVVPTCTATESAVPTGYVASGSPAGTCQALASAGECTITNSERRFELTLNSPFSDNVEGPVVTWVFNCPDGIQSNVDTTSTNLTTAGITITRFTPPNSCGATPTPPAGYHVGPGGCTGNTDGILSTESCTIPIIPNDTKFTVDKDFTNDSTSTTVNVVLTCTGTTAQISTTSFGGAVDNTDDADETTNAEFYVRYAATGNTCSATESPPVPGLSMDDSQCQNKAMAHGVDVLCKITNSDTVAFKVRKQFDPLDGRQVMITLTCTPAATITVLDPSAGVFDPADFLIQNFQSGTLCTATETVPAGFTANQLDCQAFAPSKGECTILNRKGTTFPTFTPAPSGSPQPPTPIVTPVPPAGTPRPTRTPRPSTSSASLAGGVTALSAVF